MIFINEWFPNPAGSDTQNEWVELWNGGDVAVNLNGWMLQAGSKKINLSGTIYGEQGRTIGAGKYIVFKRTTTKLTLRNTDEKLFLYDANGKLVHESGFFGSAPEGKSFSRAGQLSNVSGQLFSWAEPTPGAENKISLDMGVTQNTYAAGVALNPGLTHAGFLGLLFGTSVVLAGLILYALKKHENLSKLFFGRDEAPWL